MLRQGHGQAVDTDLQGDGTARGCVDVTTIGTHTGTGHAEQRGIFARLDGYTEDAEDAAAGAVVDKAHLIDIDILGRAVGQGSEMRVKVVLPGLLQSLAPKIVEVIGTLCGGHDLFGVEGGCAQSVIVFAANVCRDLETIKARFCQLTAELNGPVFECDTFFIYRGIHHRPGFIVDLSVGQRCARLENGDCESCSLTHVIVPVVVIGLYRHSNVVASDLRAYGHADQQNHQGEEGKSLHCFDVVFMLLG